MLNFSRLSDLCSKVGLAKDKIRRKKPENVGGFPERFSGVDVTIGVSDCRYPVDEQSGCLREEHRDDHPGRRPHEASHL